MTKRKAKKPQVEDSSILLESSVSKNGDVMNYSRESIKPSREIVNSYTAPALLFIIVFTVGAAIMGWFCVQQQQSVDQLSETFTTMQKKITNLQQVMEMTEAQTDSGLDLEERIFALEAAQRQAQEKAEVALATSEKLKFSDHYLQLGALNAELDTRLAELKQVALSVTTLQAMFKNQSEEFEAVKESVVDGLSSGFALAENVAGLTIVVASANCRVDEQVASVEALNAQLEGQASDLNEMKESVHLHNAALHTINQEVDALKELVSTKQAMRALALEEMLTSVQIILDEQFFTSETLRTSIMAQMQTFYSQLENAPSSSMNLDEEDLEAEDIISITAQDATEVQEKLEDVEGKDEQQDVEDEAAAAEEEGEMQEEQPLETVLEGDVTEEQEEEEEITPDEQEEIEEQSEEPLKEDVSEEGEESAGLNREVSVDGNEEDG